MLKRDLRLFFSSFCITLILTGWVTAFLVVDNSGSRYESSATAPALEMTRADEPLHFDLALLGQWYTVTLEPLNRLEAARKQYACLVTPRRLLNLEKLYSLGVYGKKKIYNWYKENEYVQNVAKSQEGIPVE